MKSDSEKRQKHKKREVLGAAGMRMVIIQKKLVQKILVAVAACAWVIIQKKQIQVSTPNVYIKNQKKIE